MSSKERLFVAFDVPRTHREWLSSAVAERRSSLRGRWTDIDKQHVTLKFIGWLDRAQRQEVIEACSGVAAKSTEAMVRLDGLGGFPSARRARILWAGVDDIGDVAHRLASSLDQALASLVETEKRSYTPHLTLARLDPPAALDEALTSLDLSELDPFPLDEITLFRSHVSSRGSEYETVARFSLG